MEASRIEITTFTKRIDKELTGFRQRTQIGELWRLQGLKSTLLQGEMIRKMYVSDEIEKSSSMAPGILRIAS